MIVTIPKRKLSLTVGTVMSLAVISCAHSTASAAGSTAFEIHGTVFEKAGIEYNVDPVLLYSVALVESAVDGRQGFIKPSPWTLRTSVPYYGKSREEAEKELLRLLKKSRSVDVGMMQINTRWHSHRVNRITDLLDPLTNVRVGAQILSENISRYPQDAALAVGRYHSADPVRARRYANYVFRVYTAIKGDAS